MSQNLPKQSLQDFLSLRHPNHFVLVSANKRNIIITYWFLTAPVQAIQDFFWYFFCWLPPRCPAFPYESLQTHCWTYLASLRALQCSFSFWLLDWFPLHASIIVLQKGNYFMSSALSWKSCMYPSGSLCPDEEWRLYVFSMFLVSLLLLSL